MNSSLALVPQLLPVGSPVWRAVWRLAIVVVGVVCLAVSAKIHIPMWPVPMTMQTFAVLTVGMVMGLQLGATTLLAYMALGVFGFDVFSGTGGEGPQGLAYMVGPTGGYLLGFLIAGGIMGYAAERGWDRTMPQVLVAMALGTLGIFLFGVAWLAWLFLASKGMAWVLQSGFTPFLPGAVLKIGLATLVIPKGRKLSVKWFLDSADR